MAKVKEEKFDKSKIVDEKCSCGHLKSAHANTVKGPQRAMEPGHGYCKNEKCKCSQFTWVDFVFKA